MKKTTEVLVVTLLMFWVIYNLIALLNTGFIGDDAYNSQIKGFAQQRDQTVHQYIVAETIAWAKAHGRFFVLVWYMTYGIYGLTQDPVVVKSINIAIIAGGIFLFYVFTKRETKSVQVALLSCLVAPILFQFRIWHDPIMFFTFLIPMSFTLIIGSLVLYQKFLDGAGRVYCIWASLVYIASLTLYEIQLFLSVLFFILAISMGRSFLKALIVSLPFTIPSGLLIVLSYAVRAWNKSNGGSAVYSGTEINLNPLKLMHAFAVQLYATFPLSYFFFNNAKLKLIYCYSDLLVIPLFWAGTAFLMIQISRRRDALRCKGLILFGLVLLILPALLSAVSGHQGEIAKAGFGYGYITVYMQYFGLASIAVIGLSVAINKSAPKRTIAFAVSSAGVLALIAGLNLGLNRSVVKHTNTTYKYPAELLKAAIFEGLFSELKSGDIIFRAMRVPSDYTTFLTTYTGKIFTLCEITDSAACNAAVEKIMPETQFVESLGGLKVINLVGRRAWITSYNIDGKAGNDGRYILGRVERIIQSAVDGNIIRIIVADVKVYDLKTNLVKTYDFSEAPIDFLRLLSKESLDIAKSIPITDKTYTANDIICIWSGGVLGMEGNEAQNVRWVSGAFSLKLFNLSKNIKPISISMTLATPGKNEPELELSIGGRIHHIKLNSVPFIFKQDVSINPGLTEITFKPNGSPIPNGDPRGIIFGVYNFNFSETNVGLNAVP